MQSEIGHNGGMPNHYGVPEIQCHSRKGSRPESASKKYSVDMQFGTEERYILKRCKSPLVSHLFCFFPVISTVSRVSSTPRKLCREAFSVLAPMRTWAAATAAKPLQSCLTLCDPIDSSPPGFPVPGILQARTLEWVAISFSNAWKWKVKVKSLSRVRPSATPWTCSLPGSSIHGIFQARVLEWGAIAFSARCFKFPFNPKILTSLSFYRGYVYFVD